MNLRPFEPKDADGVVALIERVYREYGERICLDNADKDLSDVPGHYGAGRFMVLEKDSQVLGTVALAPDGARMDCCFLKRLYLDPELRGEGAGDRLLEWARETGRELGFSRMELWSDVRFERAHAFYKKQGFGFDGAVREMDDGWEPYREYFFYCEL